MFEFECHDWKALRGRRQYDARRLLERLATSATGKEWNEALNLINFYSSDNGIPSEATQHVVACLIAVAIDSDGDKRSEILGLVEEFTCGLGIEAYTSEEMGWHVAAVRELGCALQIWVKLAESAPVPEATVCLQLLSYCSVYDPRLEPRVMRYFEVCRVARPELGDEIAALAVNSTDRKALLAAPNRWGVQLA